MRFALIGFMGAGKSTLLNEFQADFPGLTFDLDHQIAKHLSVASENLGDWIRVNGFESFRKVESLVLSKMINQSENLLISLGGGAFNASNIEILKQHEVLSIWLKVPPEECWDRISCDKNRPILDKGKGAFLDLYKKREEFYKKANYVISAPYIDNGWTGFYKKHLV